jgi:nitrogen fixation/metabolism regulation signal transduction histidine kinase
MSQWLKRFVILDILMLLAAYAWAGASDHNEARLMILLLISIPAVIIAGLVVFLPRILKSFRKDSLSSQTGATNKLNLVVIFTVSFIVIVIVIAGFALDRIKEKIQTDVGSALQTVLQTTQQSLNLWADSNTFRLTQLAGEPQLVSMTERQLRVPRNKKALLKSNVLKDMRAFFQQNKDRFGQAGFFIISSDLANIAAMQDNSIGAKNLVASQALDLLNSAFQGEAVLVPPIWSDVHLIASQPVLHNTRGDPYCIGSYGSACPGLISICRGHRGTSQPGFKGVP